jgi:hypothetical protein
LSAVLPGAAPLGETAPPATTPAAGALPPLRGLPLVLGTLSLSLATFMNCFSM